MDDLAAVINAVISNLISLLVALMRLCILAGVAILHMIFIHGASTLFLEVRFVVASMSLLFTHLETLG